MSLLIATGSALVLLGLKSVLAEEPGIDVSETVDCPEAAVRAIREKRPSLVIAEPMFWSRIAGQIGDYWLAKVVILGPQFHSMLLPAIASRVCGYISERDPLQKVKVVARTVANCGYRFGEGYCRSCPVRSTIAPANLPLTARESQVFQRIAEGLRSGEIARTLGLSVKTVESHRENIKRKLGLASAGELFQAAILWKAGHPIAALKRGEAGLAQQDSRHEGQAEGRADVLKVPPRSLR